MDVDFYYDIACPRAAIAVHLVRRVAVRAGATLRWCPVLRRRMVAAVGPGAAASEARRKLERRDVLAQADLAGVALRWRRDPLDSARAMALLVAAPPERRGVLTEILVAAAWIDHAPVADPVWLDGVAEHLGIAPAHRDPAAMRALDDATDAAVARGVFGVPTAVVGERVFWGADRVHFVAEALGLSREPPPSGPGQGTVVFVHDVASPFSYLGSTQVERVAAEAGVDVEPVPILLGGLFREIGTPNVPMLAMPEAHRAYVAQDLADWARWWDVPLRWPSRFPIRSVTAQRVLVQQPRAMAPLYRAAWVEDRDVSDPAVVASVCDEAGFDGGALVEGARDPEVKAALFANTRQAAALGVCGVPSFLVGGQIFWGQDRLEMVGRALRGWRPPGG